MNPTAIVGTSQYRAPQQFDNSVEPTSPALKGREFHTAIRVKQASWKRLYVPYGQVPNVEARPVIVLRTSVEPASVTNALRKAVADVDANVPMDQIETMKQIVYGSVGESRFGTTVLGLFALLALFVSAIGLYGVMSYAVSQRTHEFGIRMALGATRGASLLYGVKPFDVATLASVSILLASVVLLASFVPARPASKVDPMDSLRYE